MLNMEFSLEGFVAQPTLLLFYQCSKENLLSVAEHYDVTVMKQQSKKVLQRELLAALSDQGILSSGPEVGAVSMKPVQVQEALRMKEMELEMRRLDLKELELRNQVQLRELEERTKLEIRLKELELDPSSPHRRSAGSQAVFDVNKCIRMIPPFNERDVDKYFILFERVAGTLKWPRDVWPLLLQCVLTGKAQEAYASLSPNDSLEYDKVKTAVLRAFELVPEAYRQKFRRYKKYDSHTYAEFGREKEALFDRWCQSKEITDFGKLRELILMEEFRNCLPDKIATYIAEQKVSTLSAASMLADEYVLTHRDSFDKVHLSSERASYSPWRRANLSQSDSIPVKPYVPPARREVEKSGRLDSGDGAVDRTLCSYCRKPGHTMNRCFALRNKSRPAKSVVLIKSEKFRKF